MCPVAATAINSPGYQIQEDFIGDGGSNDAASSHYGSQESIGAPAIGAAAGNVYGTQSGATTTNDPTLSFSVNAASVNLGALSSSTTKTGTASFSVSNYTSYGYVVQILGNPPDNGAHALSAMNPAATSVVGTEQFGINLVANTIPITFGANPQQIPDNSFSFGNAANGYSTPNLYKYIPGDVIATSTKSSGKTTFTISYMTNIANNTQQGSYSGNQILVATGTY